MTEKTTKVKNETTMETTNVKNARGIKEFFQNLNIFACNVVPACS